MTCLLEAIKPDGSMMNSDPFTTVEFSDDAAIGASPVSFSRSFGRPLRSWYRVKQRPRTGSGSGSPVVQSAFSPTILLLLGRCAVYGRLLLNTGGIVGGIDMLLVPRRRGSVGRARVGR